MDPLFNVHNPKIIPDSDISRTDILRIGRELKNSGLLSPAARLEFEKLLNRAQSGGLKREELHDLLQKMVSEGKIIKDRASRIARILIGSSRKDLIQFKDISESRQGRQTSHAEDVKNKIEDEDSRKKFKEEADRIRMEKLKASDPDISKNEEPKKDPHRLKKIAAQKVRERREDEFRKKMEEVREQRQEHLNPEIFESKPEPSRAELYLSARQKKKESDEKMSSADSEEPKSLQEKADEKRKSEREAEFRTFMERMKSKRLQHGGSGNPENKSGVFSHKDPESSQEDDELDNKPQLKF